MAEKKPKVHTGFRLSSENFTMIEKYETLLGINRTGVVDMILTLVRTDEKLMIRLIKKAMEATS